MSTLRHHLEMKAIGAMVSGPFAKAPARETQHTTAPGGHRAFTSNGEWMVMTATRAERALHNGWCLTTTGAANRYDDGDSRFAKRVWAIVECLREHAAVMRELVVITTIGGIARFVSDVPIAVQANTGTSWSTKDIVREEGIK